jgi:hypothetical protein
MNRNNSEKLDIILDLLNRQQEQLDTLEKRLCDIEEKTGTKLDQIYNKNIKNHVEVMYDINKINESTKNMDDHIDFVENVYNVVKYPFVNALKYYYGENDSEYKEIESIVEYKRIKN